LIQFFIVKHLFLKFERYFAMRFFLLFYEEEIGIQLLLALIIFIIQSFSEFLLELFHLFHISFIYIFEFLI
jgi:hypothetical protein